MASYSGRARYLELADHLRQAIRTGELQPGDALPSTAQLKDEHDVSTTVIRSALQLLRSEGLIVGQQGKAVYVREAGGASEKHVGSPDYEAIMNRLDELARRLDQVVARVSDLEDAASPPPRRPGAQPR